MPDERPISRISVNCFRVWVRFDLKGLTEWARTHRLVVRVPVDRQKWPEPLVG